MWLWLLACADKADGPSLDSRPELHSAQDSAQDSALQDCALQPQIVAEPSPAPGQESLLSLVGALPEGATLSWTVPSGELQPEGAQARWWVDRGVATHVAETLEVSVTVEAPGCLPETGRASWSVDWPEAQRVVVVWNPLIEGSEDVALAYAASREIPSAQLCEAPYADRDLLLGADYPAWIEALQACIDAIGEHVHYLVPVYGVPYKVSDRIGDLSGSGVKVVTSLDALMVLGETSARRDQVMNNPLYRSGDSSSGTYTDYLPFGAWRDARSLTYYLVARIDGADRDQALALVERAALAQQLADLGELSGTVYVDGNRGDTPPETDLFGSYESGEWNMWGTRRVFEADGRYPVVWDGDYAEFGTAPAPLECPDALYYAGWYSYYHYNDVFTWAPGAVAGHLDSCSACDIRSGATWSGGALLRGVTATFGAVNEPYVAGMPEYDQFFYTLLQGASFGEAAYESTVVGLWMMVWIGDPLYRPYGAAR